MKRSYKIGQHVYRILPCPVYDISSIEAWLMDMAAEGLVLTKDGIFAGVVTFEYGEPQERKYRLEAAQKNTSMWAEGGGEPDQEQIEISEKYSWEYVAKVKDFYIFVSKDQTARELNTDPEVQALALNAVKKRQREAIISSILLFVFYPILLTRGCPVLTMIATGAWWSVLALIMAILIIADDIRAFVYLKGIQRDLLEQGYYVSEESWRKKAVPYHCRRALKTVLAVILVFAFLHNWSDSITSENKMPIEKYSEELPFATIRDFAGESYFDYQATMSGMSMDFNTVEVKNDWVAPCVIMYNEHAMLKTAEGKCIDGGLYVDYYEVRNEALAKELVKELYRTDKRQKHFDIIDAPEVSADYIAAYLDNLHFPTVTIRKGNIVVKANFFQTSSEYKVPLEEWVNIVCDSFGN